MQKHRNFTAPAYFSLPFTLLDSTPLVPVTINGRQGHILFDSGAQDLLVNARHFEADKQEGENQIQSVTGSSSAFFVGLEAFLMGGFEIRGGEVLAVSLEHVEEEFGQELLGLVGFRQLIHFDWMADYGAGQIHLWERAKRAHYPIAEQIPLKFFGHLPMLPVQIGGTEYRMLLDTGCEMVLLDEGLLDKMEDVVSDLEMEAMASGSAEVREMNSGRLEGFQVGKMDFGPCKVTFTDLQRMRQAMGDFDGIIGYPLLRTYRCVVSWNYRRMWLLEPGKEIDAAAFQF